MKSKVFPLLVVVGVLMLVSFSTYQVYDQTLQDKPAKQQIVKYTCTMHPEVVQDMPGKCPKCGMTLVEKKEHLMRDTTMMKKSHMMRDTTMMKKSHMMHDSTMMKKGRMMHDSTSVKHDHLRM